MNTSYVFKIVLIVLMFVSAIYGIRKPSKDNDLITIEAEDFSLLEPAFSVKNDIAASGGKSVVIPKHAGRGWKNEAGGLVEYDLTIEKDCSLYIWGRTKWLGGCENAFYLQIDSTRKIVFGNDAIYNQWHWVQSGPFNVSAGNHKLILTNHSDGIFIDKFEFTSSRFYSPIGYGTEIDNFFDGFGGCDGQNAGSWKVVKGKWKVISDSSSNVNSQSTSSTYASISDDLCISIAHQIQCHDFNMSVDLMSPDKGTFGILFNYVDKNNYYSVELTSQSSNNLSLYKVSSGKRTKIISKSYLVERGAWYNLSISYKENSLICDIDSNRIFNLDNLIFPTFGHNGLFSNKSKISYFDNIKITLD